MKADCLLTDIPYGEVNKAHESGLRKLNKQKADDITFQLSEYLVLADKCVLGVFLIFCGQEQVSEIISFFHEKHYVVRLLIWEKTNPSPMNGQYNYLSSIECCVYAKKKGGTFNAFCKSSVLRHPCGESKIHPTEKPLKLWYDLLKDNTNEGQLVLDTCMGSFTTAVACHKLGRHFIGAELNKEYYKIGQKRLNDAISQLSVFDI